MNPNPPRADASSWSRERRVVLLKIVGLIAALAVVGFFVWVYGWGQDSGH